MDRLTDADPDNRVPYWRQDLYDGATVRNEDDDLQERIDQDGNPTADPSGLLVDRKDREYVAYYQDSQGRWKPTLLKRGDHVICGGLPLVVIGPARDRRFFNGYYYPWFGDSVIPIEALYVYERAPEDPNETPMPIIPIEEPPPAEEPPAALPGEGRAGGKGGTP
jgi:hypothetical protein